jgi:uncharacterized protein YfaS (alpha-2-macroglobulin family)
LALRVNYDRTSVIVHEVIDVAAIVENRGEGELGMMMVELPVPPGFDLLAEQLDHLRQQDVIAKYHVRDARLVIYLRQIRPAESISIPYQLQARLPARVSVPGGVTYAYYDPDLRAMSPPLELQIDPIGGHAAN